MKKHKVSALLFGLLILCSVGAFTYLNVVTPLNGHSNNDEQVHTTTHMEEMEKSVLPDVKFIQKAVETGKRFIPAF